MSEISGFVYGKGFALSTYLSKSIWDGGDTNQEMRLSQQREDYYA